MLEGGGGAAGRLLRALLWIPGRAYGAAMAARRRLYGLGLLPSRPSRLPVISVGNLTAGGSGKTPMVAMLARELLGRGHRPGILLRGYRQTGEGISDEAELYGRLCPGATVWVGSDRVASAERAEAAGADVLLLDDGFQHIRLRRDLDIVLIDAASPWGGGNAFPGGLLREPRSALRAAGAVVVTRADQRDRAFIDALLADIARLAPGVPVFTARHKPVSLVDAAGGEHALSELADRPVVAVSGIARPEAFRRTLLDLGAEVRAEAACKDHGEFAPAQLRTALETATRIGGVVVTTEKDQARKIFAGLADNMNVWTLGVRQEVEDADGLLSLVFRAAGGNA